MKPGYLEISHNDLSERVEKLKSIYCNCELCPHNCGVNRLKGEKGKCRSGDHAVIASYNSHFGEEPPISGWNGSGTIFLTGCTGKCIFCQNYPISQLGIGKVFSDKQVAEIMIGLQKEGCHNINFVTPTHFVPSILSSIQIAKKLGLTIPIVYNSSGYEKVETLKLLDGIIDIYLPDSKYADDSIAFKISGLENYIENNRASLKEMFRQVGNIVVEGKICQKGIIVRHLILPENFSGSKNVFSYLAENISKDIYVSVMDQYFPAYNSLNHEILSRRISQEEYDNSIEAFYDSGLHNGWIQEHIG